MLFYSFGIISIPDDASGSVYQTFFSLLELDTTDDEPVPAQALEDFVGAIIPHRREACFDLTKRECRPSMIEVIKDILLTLVSYTLHITIIILTTIFVQEYDYSLQSSKTNFEDVTLYHSPDPDHKVRFASFSYLFQVIYIMYSLSPTTNFYLLRLKLLQC